MDTTHVLADVPDYRELMTVAELSASSRELARQLPTVVTLQSIGISTEGRAIEMLTIGRGTRTALLVGTPRPHEAIGALALEALARRLAEDEGLRAALDCRFLVIKCSDPDGALLNEGWLKPPFSPLAHALNFYCSPRREQVGWSFPVHYRTLHFTETCPETRAVMEVMEHERPGFLGLFHNVGLRGASFALSRPLPGLAARLRRVATGQQVPIHHGEPPAPHVKRLEDGIYTVGSVQEEYDYLARNLPEDPAPYIEAGTSADEYLKTVVAGFTFVCEVPQYFDPALQDTSPAGTSRREALLQGLFRVDSIYHDVREYFGVVGRGAPRDRIYRSIDDYAKKTPKRLAALKREVEAPQYAREATRAEAFDATVGRVFEHMLYLGEVYRLAVARGSEEVARIVRRRLEEICAQIEAQGTLQALPLRRLVAVQVGGTLQAIAAWKELDAVAGPGGR